MRALPSIQSAGDLARLPLSHASAAELARLLVLPGDGTSDTCPDGGLIAALSIDPALVLWCVIRADGQGFDVRCSSLSRQTTDQQPTAETSNFERRTSNVEHAELPAGALRSVPDVAAWLQRHARTVLRWADDLAPIDDRHLPRYADLAATAVHVAELSAQVAQRRGGDAEQARLIGLLHQASEWLVVAGDPPASGLPFWLREAIAIASRAPRDDDASPAGCAALARAIVVDGSPVPAGMRLPRGQGPQKDGQRRADEVRKGWLHPSQRAADWLPELAARLARLADLETSFDERLEAEKLESLAELAAGAGHEINNPLAVISGRVQLFLREERDPERRRDLAVLNTQSLRVHEMIADMMLFARPPRPRPEPVDLTALIQRLLADLGPRAAERGIELENGEVACSLSIEADATQIMVALRAVCENALQAIGRDGRIVIAARPSPADPDAIEITIRDSGPGIPPAVRRHLFDPFYSGRQSGRGLGMGLAKCWRIVTNHGGRIDVESEPGHGACFTIRLPKVAAMKRAGVIPSDSTAGQPGPGGT